MSTCSSIHIFAEHLVHLGLVCITINLPTKSNSSTRATFSPDFTHLTVQHKHQTATLLLPARIDADKLVVDDLKNLLQEPPDTTEFTWRISTENGKYKDPFDQLLLEPVIPWMAPQMKAQKGLGLCRGCTAPILLLDNIKNWNEMPSEHWAEMMDLWSCHKPKDESDPADGLHHNGYASNKSVQLFPQSAFTGQSYFIVNERDCKNTAIGELSIQCANCRMNLGEIDFATGGLKLQKWSLTIDNQVFPSEKWLTLTMLDIIEDGCVRRFIVDCHESVEMPLLLWVFINEVNFSTTSSSGLAKKNVSRAVKMLWKEKMESDEESTRDLDIISLPLPIYRELVTTLIQSTKLLPPSARLYHVPDPWNVGLLERF